MSITAGMLFRDSVNFLRNQFSQLILLALLVSFIPAIVNQLIPQEYLQIIIELINSSTTTNQSIDIQQLQHAIQQLSVEQHRQLMNLIFTLFFSLLITYTLLIGGTLTLINQATQGNMISALRAISLSITILPQLLLLLCFIFISVFLGATLLFLPGIILAIILALSPTILILEKKGIFNAIAAGSKLGWQNMWKIAFILLFWFATSFITGVIFQQINFGSPAFSIIISSTLKNLIMVFVLVYLSRLYMLTR